MIGSPGAAREWSRLISHEESARRRHRDLRRRPDGHDDRARAARPRHPRALRRGPRSSGRARWPRRCREARVFHASAFDPEFFERERIGRATAAVFALNDDPGNLFSAVLAKAHGVKLTIALAHDQSSLEVYERGGVDVAINPRQVIAEELVRFGHDPRIRQIAMLDDDRFEILDLTVRPESELAGTRFDELPETGSVIGAIVRDGRAFFPHGSDELQRRRPRDRVRRVAPRLDRRTRAVRLRTGIDVGSALDLVGGVLKWLAPAFLLPTAVAIGYGEPFWSFLVAGAITGVTGPAARPDHGRQAGRRGDAARELPRRRADLAAGADLRRAAVHPRRRPAARAAARRVLRERLRLHRDGRDDRGRGSRSCRARCCSGASSATGSAAWASSCSPSRSCRGCGSAGASCCSPSSPARPRSSSSATRSARRRGGCGCST